MKSSGKKLAAVLLTAVFTMTGCGDALYELTPEEETAIVSYAAHSVAKFNTYQQDGQIFVMKEVLEGEQEDKNEPQQPAQNEPQQTGGERGESGGEVAQETEIPQTEMPQTDTGSTLNEALDLGVISAECIKKELCKTYQQEGYYAVDAEAGKQLLVLTVNLTNTASQALHIDILAMTPSFHVSINDMKKIPAQTTILLNDLGTYQSDIAAGATNETVLLFQVPDSVEEISNIKLYVTMNGSQYTVNL